MSYDYLIVFYLTLIYFLVTILYHFLTLFFNDNMKVQCPLFDLNEPIPKKYTCRGENVNPPLEIQDIPEKTKSLVLIIDDPDAPGSTFTHWVVYDIDPMNKINENSNPGVQGLNDFHVTSYKGPCPPNGEHQYFFKLYALDRKLSLSEGTKREKVLSEMQDHIIESCNTIGRFKKNN